MVNKKSVMALWACIFIFSSLFSNFAYAESSEETPIPNAEKPKSDEDEKRAKKFAKKAMNEQSFKERLIERVPYGEEAHYMWNVVDGDVDLYFEGLRADRRNKGITYTTNFVPMMGNIEGLEMEFSAGDTTEFSFKSKVTPFLGEVKGLSYRGSVSNEDSKIFARYTYKFD